MNVVKDYVKKEVVTVVEEPRVTLSLNTEEAARLLIVLGKTIGSQPLYNIFLASLQVPNQLILDLVIQNTKSITDEDINSVKKVIESRMMLNRQYGD